MSNYIHELITTYNWMTLSNLVICLINFLMMFAFHRPVENKPNYAKSLLASLMMFWMGFISFRIITLTYDGNIDLGELGLNATLLIFIVIERGNVYKALKAMTSTFLKK
ncbi:phage holin family protein [Thorsellia anophelis]|uniref:3TM holin, Phage_holin_3 n=1 Tax=Thorsellia anophelis DSM 18579 TaxID=1123402 RepID=A0A1I0D9E4_9GAMM|nr:phage holin family protein [Thorsellia anophelis]SET28691.1 Putative 3TM holin, Phage_holin_3 [Thorsellia anophelis DSM 18579]